MMLSISIIEDMQAQAVSLVGVLLNVRSAGRCSAKRMSSRSGASGACMICREVKRNEAIISISYHCFVVCHGESGGFSYLQCYSSFCYPGNCLWNSSYPGSISSYPHVGTHMTREEKILKLKEDLRARAREKFPNDEERQNRYVWGTISKIKERMKQ